MKELLETIARALVDYPEDVSVNEVEGERSLILGIKSSKRGYGKGNRKTRQNSKSNKNSSESCSNKGR